MSTVVSQKIKFDVYESSNGVYDARALNGDIVTEANSVEELKDAVRKAVNEYYGKGDKPPLIHLCIMREEIIFL